MSKKTVHKTAESDRVPNGQKFAYGLGSIVNNLLGSAIGFMSIVLNVGLGVNPALVGTLQAIPRITDAITTRLWVISRIKQNRDGEGGDRIFSSALSWSD